MSPLIAVILGALGGLGCLVAALGFLRRKRLIDDMPTSKTQGVFIGLTEVKGTAETDSPLTSFLGGVPCVYYSWEVSEHWSRTVHETYTDAQGRSHVRTRTESGWSRVAGGVAHVSFYVRDDTGIIRVLAEGAAIRGTTSFDRTCARGDPLYFGKGPPNEVVNSDHRRRFRETAVPLHAMLYVIGQARVRQDVVAAEIAYDRNAPMYVISTRTEKQVSARYGHWFWFWLVAGLLVSLSGAALWAVLGAVPGSLWRPVVLGAIAYTLAAWLGWVWLVYNSLIALHHRVEQAWSQVDVELARRHDLIPNLVQAVQGYSSHETETQKLLSELRGQIEATRVGAAGSDLRGLASSLRIAVENYPELKADELFPRLQQSLVETEQRIALARDYSNEIATFYNTRLQIVPDRFIAVLARLRPQALLRAAEFERAPVRVELVP